MPATWQNEWNRSVDNRHLYDSFICKNVALFPFVPLEAVAGTAARHRSTATTRQKTVEAQFASEISLRFLPVQRHGRPQRRDRRELQADLVLWCSRNSFTGQTRQSRSLLRPTPTFFTRAGAMTHVTQQKSAYNAGTSHSHLQSESRADRTSLSAIAKRTARQPRRY